jgi:3'-5' exoribonuclease 1
MFDEGLKVSILSITICVHRGDDTILKKRLKVHARKEVILSHDEQYLPMELKLVSNPLGIEYLVIVDFEATCLDPNPPDYVHEIIEFPAILYNVNTRTEVDAFHSYCKPVLNPQLSEFCCSLTGISQRQVDKASTFVEIFKCFEEWLDSKKLFSDHNFSLACDGIWDIARCLSPQCALSGIDLPKYAQKWIDIRKLFSSFYRYPRINIEGMLGHLGLVFEGRQHCGLDDARNIVRILHQLLEDGCEIRYNRYLTQ